MLRYKTSQKTWHGEAVDGVQHPHNIESMWSDAELDAIGLERFTPPPPPPPEPANPLETPLSPVQFQAMLRLTNKYDEIMAAVANLPNPDRAIAQAKIEYSLNYFRSNPLFDMLGSAIGMTPEQIDALWVQALEIE